MLQVRARTREEWKSIPGWEGLYEGSLFGRVRSLVRVTRSGRRGGQILRQQPNTAGYPTVYLCRDGVRHTRMVHRLVARAFHGLAPRYVDGTGRIRRMETRHLDGNPGNPRADNLCWGTKAENAADRSVHGTDGRGDRHWTRAKPHRIARGESVGSSKLAAADIPLIRIDGRSQDVIASEYGVSQSLISQIKSGKAWAHV